MPSFPIHTAMSFITGRRDRTAQVQQVLNNTAHWASVTSLSDIEAMASELHQCRLGVEQEDLRDVGARQLVKLLREVDARVTECWNRYSQAQSNYLDNHPTNHIDADSKALIKYLLAEDEANSYEPTLRPKKRSAPDINDAKPSEPATKSSRHRVNNATAVSFRGIPNQGNTCYINTPLAALAMSSGVSRAVDDRIQTLENNHNDPEAESHLPVLRNLKACLNHINGTQPLNRQHIATAVNQLRSDMTQALGYIDLTQNVEGDTLNDFLLPLLANFLPNYCAEGAIIRSSTGPSTTNPDIIQADTFDEVGLVQLSVADGITDQSPDLASLLTRHFEPKLIQTEGPNSNPNTHELHLSSTPPESLVIMLNRTIQRSDAINPQSTAAPQGFHPERPLYMTKGRMICNKSDITH